jgi:nitrogen fixation protein
LNGQQRICLYSSEYVPSYGLMVNALGYDPALDRYTAESQITDPTPGQTITTCTYLVQGNSHDYYTGVTQVEVSTDNGSTWTAAQGATNWSYNWTIPQDGTYLLKVRARDQAGNIEVPTTAVTVTVSALCGAATVTATPATTRTSTPVPTATPCAINFSDVLPTDYFYVPVRYLFCAGAISGYSDGTFRPYANTTRGQLTKIVVLAEGWTLYTPPTPTFSDVPTTHTFYQYIETAYSRGIIAGYADGTFRPGNNVTRGQLAKIIVLAEGWTLICPPVPSFTDVPIGDPFYCYIETARQRGIISGYSDGTFRPGNSATRGQISKIVYEAITAP